MVWRVKKKLPHSNLGPPWAALWHKDKAELNLSPPEKAVLNKVVKYQKGKNNQTLRSCDQGPTFLKIYSLGSHGLDRLGLKQRS